MACLANFGEILEPTSRAFWDGLHEDDEDPDIKSHFLSKSGWEWENSSPDGTKLTKIIIIEGSDMADFLKTTIFKDLKPIGKSRNGNIIAYFFENLKQLIIYSNENDLNLSGIQSKEIKNLIESVENVITISLQSKVQYKANDLSKTENQITFLRGINSKYKYAKELKAPNFITGLSAGVATIRYINKLSIESYIGYTDPSYGELDGISTQPIIKLFKDIGIVCQDKYKSKTKDQSLLYM